MINILRISIITILLSHTQLHAVNINDIVGITKHASQSEVYGMMSNDHKKWAKEFHSEISDIDRYRNNVREIVGHDIKFKPKQIKINGINMRISMRSEIKNGGMAEIVNASEFAYNGNTFYSVTVDHSKCKSKENFSDCMQDSGSSRVELIAEKDWTWKEGTEKWLSYAIMPGKNILFNNRSRRFTVGQCHPLQGEMINWMIKFKNKNLILTHNFKSHQNDDGKWEHSKYYNSEFPLKKFKANEINGSREWTNIKMQFKNTYKEDGILRVWVDDNLAYEYLGPTSWKGDRDKCTFKLGLYTNANLKSVNKESRENMVVLIDAMAIGKNEENLLKNLNKDK